MTLHRDACDRECSMRFGVVACVRGCDAQRGYRESRGGCGRQDDASCLHQVISLRLVVRAGCPNVVSDEGSWDPDELGFGVGLVLPLRPEWWCFLWCLWWVFGCECTLCFGSAL